MNKQYLMELQIFAEEAAAADAGIAEAGAAETGAEGPIIAGDRLADGTEVPNAQVAAALERQMKRHPELRQVYGRGRQAAQAKPAKGAPMGAANQPGDGNELEARWEEAKKGEYKDMYARDVQNAIRDRFKNQEDATKKLTDMQPMLDALMQKAGVNTVEELRDIVLDDDSLYEEAAEEAGMTVSAYKTMQKLQKEHDEAIAREQETQQQIMFRNHIANLAQQAEELKRIYPDFDLQREMQNEAFFRMTSPEGGISVEDAYFAVHHKELAPQMMGYGMRRAQQQMSQTIQARQKRPAEGAMRNQGQTAADVRLNPAKLTRKERDALRREIHAGKLVSFD